ncbi:sigma-70 family RNA polymerase sigma factor [soil metagenome]
MNGDPFLVTRLSLVERLADRGDQENWRVFFDTYWKLIYGVSLKAGLSDDEAQDVVQETVITVSRNIDGLKYDPSIGSFKGWLLQITRWRIIDQFRKRKSGDVLLGDDDSRDTAVIDRVADPDGFDLEAIWDAEWKESLLTAAMDRVKKKVDPKHYQIFDCYVIKGWAPGKVAKELRVNIAQVYLARHRVGALVRKEVELLERSAV